MIPAELIEVLASFTQIRCHCPLVVDDASTDVVVSPPQNTLILPSLPLYQLRCPAQTRVELAKVRTLVRRAQLLRVTVRKSHVLEIPSSSCTTGVRGVYRYPRVGLAVLIHELV